MQAQSVASHGQRAGRHRTDAEMSGSGPLRCDSCDGFGEELMFLRQGRHKEKCIFGRRDACAKDESM